MTIRDEVRAVGWALLTAAIVTVAGGCEDGSSSVSAQTENGQEALSAGGKPVRHAGAGGSGDFVLLSISVPFGAVSELNQDVEFAFNQEVNFLTVSLNTIRIYQLLTGAPAQGTFSFKGIDTSGDGVPDTVDRTIVVFQPTCPTDDSLQAGLDALSKYRIELPGTRDGVANVVEADSGDRLVIGHVSFFRTPDPGPPSVLFADGAIGPPVPYVRNAGSTVDEATRLEIGAAPSDRVYFEATSGGIDTNPSGFAAPLNLYSDPDSALAFVLELNQPILPTEQNLALLRLECFDTSAGWQPLATHVTLVANCSARGATVRLEPNGILPQGSGVRAVILPGFQDLVGQATLLQIDSLEVATQTVAFTSLSPADDLADEVLEEFDFGGDGPLSLEDTEAVFDVPRADWSGGSLTADVGFDATGGPGGDFDWYVRDGDILFFDTTVTQIVGGPGGVPTTIQNCVNGLVEVRDLVVEDGGEIRVQGPNRMLINASGDVIIRGTIDLSGFNARDVATLNTGNQPEQGAPGVGGGGRGGNASEVTNNSTPRGGTGQGAFGVLGLGGQGGESGYADPMLGKDARRPGGGGGGRFASDLDNLKAEPGFPGEERSTGAESGMMPAAGGAPGPSAFVDGDSTNDFYGDLPVVDEMGNLVDLVRGELPGLWAGAGGGGGGDALPSTVFPTPNWNQGSDEKGGAGGGASGGFHAQALGRIVFGANGEIVANGGHGAVGENTIFLDHIGGTGGSASGGHVLLESAVQIDFTDSGTNMAVRDYIAALGGPRRIGPNMGGQLPLGVSHGGAGGPGVIQLHVPDPTKPPAFDPGADIRVPIEALLAEDPLDELASPPPYALLPMIGARSKARSRWISLGGADKDPAGGEDLVAFLFGGVETAPGPDQGKILATNDLVDELAPLLGPNQVGSPGISIAADEVTLVLEGGVLLPLIGDVGVPSNDVYLRNPALLRNFVVRLENAANPQISHDYVVTSASYDDAQVILSLTVDAGGTTLQDFVDSQQPMVVNYLLVPRFFRVATGGQADELPFTTSVRILFQGTGMDAAGEPDTENPLVDWTGDISDFNALAPGELAYFRFQVEFDLDVNGMGLSPATEATLLDFLRVPFGF